MPTIQRFEDIRAWQRARELARRIYLVSGSGEFARDFGLRDQIRRAAVSVVSNIAERIERDGTVEFHQLLAHAKGSVGEVRAQLYVAADVGLISHNEFAELSALALDVSRLLSAFMRYLQQTEVRGRKYQAPSTADRAPGTPKSRPGIREFEASYELS